jgi:hypothetical protein
MAELYRFLASNEALIYIVMAIGGVFAFRWLWISWNEWQSAVYKLEREFASRRLGQSAAASALIIILFCTEFFLVSFLIPGLPALVFLSTPTLDFIATPTGTLSTEMMTQFAVPPALTPIFNSSGCIPEKVIFTSPTPGEEVKGKVDLVGTVNIPNLGFYKYEVARQGSDAWATISGGSKMVINASLGKWDTSALTPGDYQLRLIVTDNQAQAFPACILPVRVVAP